MAHPAFAGVQAGESKIRGAAAEEKEDYSGGESRIGLSGGGHSEPDGLIVEQSWSRRRHILQVVIPNGFSGEESAFPQIAYANLLAQFPTLVEDVL
jgi:hypothetical protein